MRSFSEPQRVDSLLVVKQYFFSFEGRGNFSLLHQAASGAVEIWEAASAKTFEPSKGC